MNTHAEPWKNYVGSQLLVRVMLQCLCLSMLDKKSYLLNHLPPSLTVYTVFDSLDKRIPSLWYVRYIASQKRTSYTSSSF